MQASGGELGTRAATGNMEFGPVKTILAQNPRGEFASVRVTPNAGIGARRSGCRVAYRNFHMQLVWVL